MVLGSPNHNISIQKNQHEDDDPVAAPTIVTEGFKNLQDRFNRYSEMASAAGLFYRANTGQPSARIEARIEFVDVAEFGIGERLRANALLSPLRFFQKKSVKPT